MLGTLSLHCSPASPPGGTSPPADAGQDSGSKDAATIDSGGDGKACGQRCAADLQHVVDDCTGKVLKTCNPDQGCFDGECNQPPCTAAEKTKSSVGCEFWALKTDMASFSGDNKAACFAAFVANTWSKAAQLKLSYKGKALPASALRIPKGQGLSLTYDPYDSSKGLAPGEVAIAFLSQEPQKGSTMPPCPAPPALSVDPSVEGTGRGFAFKLESDVPVVAYQMLPFGGGASAATSATLLLPTSAWNTDYLAINAYKRSELSVFGMPTLAILAQQDKTEVTLLPKVFVDSSSDVQGGPAGKPLTTTLNRGEYLQFTQGLELTGSPVTANKPIAVFGGSTCLNIPVDKTACDTGQQQIPPIRSMGSEYAAVRYRGRKGKDESVPWRLVGVVNGTKLSWTPSKPKGAPDTLSLGQVAEFSNPGPFVVRSQDSEHPFYAAAYMTGGDDFDGEGDPDWVNIIPSDQYLDRYVFFADPTYSETNLVVVRKRNAKGQFADVSLDCAGTLKGWKPLGNFETTRIDLVTGDFQGVGGCSNGRREMTSSAPFAVTVWGWGTIPGTAGKGLFTQYVSYAYLAGASVQPINTVVVPK